MITLIVSDIHLGSYFNRAADLKAFLGSVQFDRLIILGDLLDRPSFEDLSDGEWSFLDYLRLLARHREIIWVEGNHDAGLHEEIENRLEIDATKQFEWKVNGRKLLALHGHQFDKYSRNRSVLARYAAHVYGFLRKVDLTIDSEIFHKICFENRAWKYSSDLVNTAALEYAGDENANIIFCGHTHRAAYVEHEGRHYFNTGCWSDRHCHYVLVDDDEVRLEKFDNSCMLKRQLMNYEYEGAV